MNVLKRSFPLIDIRQDDNSLSGLAFRFSETATGWYGTERFSPELILQFNKPCFLLYAHNSDNIIGKRGENLSIEKNKEGLFFKCSPLPKTSLAMDLRELVKSKLITGASLGFASISEHKEKEVRVFTEIKIYEVSLTGNPYYKSSEVKNRANEKSPRPRPPELIC